MGVSYFLQGRYGPPDLLFKTDHSTEEKRTPDGELPRVHRLHDGLSTVRRNPSRSPPLRDSSGGPRRLSRGSVTTLVYTSRLRHLM